MFSKRSSRKTNGCCNLLCTEMNVIQKNWVYENDRHYQIFFTTITWAANTSITLPICLIFFSKRIQQIKYKNVKCYEEFIHVKIENERNENLCINLLIND